MKATYLALMFSLMVQYGCAAWGVYNEHGEKIEFSVDDLAEGNIRLVCGVNCSVRYVQMSDEMRKLHDNEAWLKLAHLVSEIGYEIDQAYYYLGRSAESLKSYDAARTYYALALKAPKCGGFFDICNGFEFPGEIRARNALLVAAENSAALEGQKAFPQEGKSNRTDEEILYKKVRKIPAKYVEKNRDGYKKLMEMSPDNQIYKKKYHYYKELSERQNNAHDKDKIIFTDEQVLYGEVKKIPSKYVKKNRDGYKKLMEINPNNQTYREKYLYYEKLSEGPPKKPYNQSSEIERNDYEKEMVPESLFAAEISKSASFAEALKNMESAGVFTKDQGKASIYVEASFWDEMSSQHKDLFCYMLQSTYPMYAQAILDKHSGQKLAEISIYGELAVIQ
jgi:hypothetical protein